MVHEVPYTSVVVSDIVQQFIHDIGIPTIEHFNRCARLLWNMSSAYSGPIPAPYPAQTTSPIASPPGSSVFIYYGTRKQNQAIVVVDSDSDDDGKPQSTGFEMKTLPSGPNLSKSTGLSRCVSRFSSTWTAPCPYYQQQLFVSSWTMSSGSSHTCHASHHSSHSWKDFVFSVIKGMNPK